MQDKDFRLSQIWRQNSIPVLYLQGKGASLLLRLPYAVGNREWIKGDGRKNPVWEKDQKCWQIPKAWFERIIRQSLARHRKIYVVQPFNPNEKCAPACWNAVGAECECSCMGKNHGSGNPVGKWHVVSETLAVRWGSNDYSCRLLTPNT